jgi:hypothetical protein
MLLMECVSLNCENGAAMVNIEQSSEDGIIICLPIATIFSNVSPSIVLLEKLPPLSYFTVFKLI